MYIIIGGDGKEYGPKPESEVREWITEGRLNAQSQIKVQGDDEWKELGNLQEFAENLYGATPVALQPPQPTSSTPVAQQHQLPYHQYSAQAQGGTNSMAVAGMICGIVSLIGPCCCLLQPVTILGIIFSCIALSQIKANPHQAGKSMAIAGLICSILSLALLVAVFVLSIAGPFFR